MKFLNWLLYEVHRWLGIGLALFMFVWFVSGLVIMYSTPMTQNRSEQLAHAQTLAPQSGWLSLGEVWERSSAQRLALKFTAKAEPNVNDKAGVISIVDAKLVRIADAPVWLVEDTRGQRVALSAIDGSVLETTSDNALTIAKNWSEAQGIENAKVHFIDTVENPIMLRNQEAVKPFHHIAIGDEGLEVLISARTGELLHVSTPIARALYWTGNWVHLFKPLDAIGLNSVRHDIQLWAGFTATIATLTGLIIGWLRWRPGFAGKKTYSQGRSQPYRENWMKWHFWAGLLGGTAALLWAFSGYLSTNPYKIFSPNDAANRPEIARYLGSDIPSVMKEWQPAPFENVKADIVELNWRRLGDNAILLAYTREGGRLVEKTNFGAQFSEIDLVDGAKRLSVNAPIERFETLTDYDSYYYPKEHQTSVEKPLPIALVQFADAQGTRLYIDPQDGRVLAKLDQSRRVYRWLFSALHYWDFGWFHYEPLWQTWMLTWVGFGLVLSASSLVIGWRRLKKTFVDLAKSKMIILEQEKLGDKNAL